MSLLVKLDGTVKKPLMDCGNKASLLNVLKKMCINIPDSFALPGVSFNEADEDFLKEVSKQVISELSDKAELIAVRSSSFKEDSSHESCAGIYDTVLNVKLERCEVADAIKKVLKSGKSNDEKIGIVFQPMIDAELAGVLFSSNPESNSKKEMVLNYSKGLGDKLVSGIVSGTEKKIDKETVSQLDDSWFKELCNTALYFEKVFFCCDMEWAVEKKTGKLFILQVRPITNVLLHEDSFITEVSNKELNHRKYFKNFSKVKIRTDAEDKCIFISPAYLVHCKSNSPKEIDEKFFESVNQLKFRRNKYCKGYNVVVISPNLVGNKILRAFAGEKNNIQNCISCNRYGVRAEPDFENLTETVNGFYKKLKDEYMSCTMIIQEIFDPEYTGIIKRCGDNYIVEIGKGHYVAKGIVPMSTYVLNKDLTLLSKRICYQDKYYGLIEGHTLEFSYGKEIDVDTGVVSKIAKTFASYLDGTKAYVEFGVLKEDENYIPYLIDYTDDFASDNIKPDQINSGVISNGYGKGKIVRLSNVPVSESLDAHFCDQNEITGLKNKDVIYLADLPEISFKDKLTENCAGFLFKEGASLCHLAVLLREKGIPAIVGVDELMLDTESVYEINTDINGTWEEKVRRV